MNLIYSMVLLGEVQGHGFLVKMWVLSFLNNQIIKLMELSCGYTVHVKRTKLICKGLLNNIFSRKVNGFHRQVKTF